MKSVLLINPWIHDFAAFDFWSKPIGLLSLGSFLRTNGYSVFFIDCLNPYHPGLDKESDIIQPKRQPWGNGKYPRQQIEKPEQLKDFPRSFSRYGIPPHIFRQELMQLPKPDIILVTSIMTYWYRGVFETISVIRDTIPDAPIVLGGNYATLCTDHARRFSGADFVLPGNGERQLALLIANLWGEELHIAFDPNNLDSYPYPAFDLLYRKDQIPIMTSRGCPYRCSYCASHILNEGFTVRSPIKVVDEIEFWNSCYGTTNFSFYDDALLVNSQERAIPMMKEILTRKLNFSFHCPNGLHLREITREVSELMFQTGFKTIRFGFETASINRQKKTGGKVTNTELATAVQNLKKAGYESSQIGVYILCGLPGQSASEIEESIYYVKEQGARPIIAEFSPIPGTSIWQEAVNASPYNLAEEPLFHNNSLMLCRNKNFSYDQYRYLKNMTRSI